MKNLTQKQTEESINTSKFIIGLGLILMIIFGYLYVYRNNFMDGKYICGIDENELCTEKTTNSYGLISLSGFILIEIGIIILLLNIKRKVEREKKY